MKNSYINYIYIFIKQTIFQRIKNVNFQKSNSKNIPKMYNPQNSQPEPQNTFNKSKDNNENLTKWIEYLFLALAVNNL